MKAWSLKTNKQGLEKASIALVCSLKPTDGAISLYYHGEVIAGLTLCLLPARSHHKALLDISGILRKIYFHDRLCALRVNYKWSDLIGRATFQSLGQLVHNVTRPLFRVHFRGLVTWLSQTLECGATIQITPFVVNVQSTQFIMKIFFTKNAARMYHMVALVSRTCQ